MIDIIKKFKNYLKLKDYKMHYDCYIRQFLRYCLDNNINYLDISLQDYSNYILSLKDKQTNGSINNYIKAIKLFYKFLLEYNYINQDKYDIICKVKLLPTERKLKATFTKDEILDLIYIAQSLFRINPYKIKAILLFMLYTGVRKSEIINLKRDDIDLDNNTAIIKLPTKTKTEGLVFYPDMVKQALIDYFNTEPEKTNAFNISRNKINWIFKRLNDYVPSGKKLTPHIMRHSFGAMLAKNMIDIRVAQKLLRHKSLHTTLIYYDPDIETIKDIYHKKIK